MSQSRELLSRNDKATVRINTAHSETPLTMPPPVAVPAGSALSFVGAWTSLSQRGALPSDLHIQTLPEQYLAVLIGDRAVGLCPYGDAASHNVAATLSNRAHLVNAMLSRVVMVYPCVSGLLVIDMDRITRDPAIRSLIRPEWETSNELVSIALVDAAARDNLPSSTTHPLSDELRTMWNATLASISAGMALSREVPLKIKTIAIPSARSPEMLERCLRSHLESMRTFCHTPPKIVVYDDASPEHQAEKKELCEKLSLEYVTTIEHRGDTEREHFLKSIVSCSGLQARESELREICFKRNSFGTMRNWIHLSNSGTTYATVDDDSLSEITPLKLCLCRTRCNFTIS